LLFFLFLKWVWLWVASLLLQYCLVYNEYLETCDSSNWIFDNQIVHMKNIQMFEMTQTDNHVTQICDNCRLTINCLVIFTKSIEPKWIDLLMWYIKWCIQELKSMIMNSNMRNWLIEIRLTIFNLLNHSRTNPLINSQWKNVFSELTNGQRNDFN
jgi:hypothetical protein